MSQECIRREPGAHQGCVRSGPKEFQKQGKSKPGMRKERRGKPGGARISQADQEYAESTKPSV